MHDRPYETILVAREGAVARITMNRPDRKNPIGLRTVNELLNALDDAKEDEAVRVIVLTGAGVAFSAGADLEDIGVGASDDMPAKGDFSDLLLRFRTLGKPMIARVNGVAVGGGLGLLASCDFAIAAESATVGTPEIKRGLFPFMIMAVLDRLVPRRRLISMILLGERISAREALDVGLLSEVVPDDQLDDTVDALAAKLAAQSPTAMRMGLAAYHRHVGRPIEETIPELQRDLYAILKTEDAKEGLMAFMQKREPEWTGR